jgi:membrane protease YdiL (CAAX protease family)
VSGTDSEGGPSEVTGSLPMEEVPEEAATLVDRRIRLGCLLTAAGVVALSLFTTLPFWDVLGLPVFYLLLPSLALAQLPLLDTQRLERIPVYLGSGATILLIGGLSLILGLRQTSPEALGLAVPPPGELLAWSVGIAVGGVLVIGLFQPLDRRVRGRHHRVLAELLPRSATERTAFAGLSGAAGVGEELAYRGYALVALQLLGVGPGGAALLSSTAFGFLHAYQGPVGIVRTGTLGFLLAASVLLTGSLVPAMVGHALIDLVAGLVLGPFLVRDEPLVPPSGDG